MVLPHSLGGTKCCQSTYRWQLFADYTPVRACPAANSGDPTQTLV